MQAPLGIDALWILIASCLVFMMQAGFLCLEVGCVRTKSATVTALKNVIDWAMVCLAFSVVGFGLTFGADAWGLFGTSYLLLDGLETSPFAGREIFFLFQLGFAGTAVTIVSGALAERVSFVSYLAASFLMGAIIYPISAHWIWGGGWLATLGFVDFAGSMAVHGIGGTMALIGAVVVGPRIGRFDAAGRVVPMESHSLALAALGVTLLWVGWWGFNGGSTLALDGRVAPVIIKTNLAGAMGGLAAFLHARLAQRGDYTTEKLIGGILGGLVAVTASCHMVSFAGALAIGTLAGLVHNYAYEALLRARVDDPVGAVPVHLACGTLGCLAAAVFAPADQLANGRLAQLGVQALGAAACLTWAGLASFGLFTLLRAVVGLRVSVAEERAGLTIGPFEEPPEAAEAVDEAALRALMGLDGRP